MSDCTGCNDGCFDESIQLTQGPAGAAGSDGLYGGWALEWDFDSSTANTTGSGEVRFNNATLSSVTHIFINDTNSDSVDASSFLASVGTTPFGRIKVFKESDSSVFWLGTITAADSTSVPAEYDLTVTHVVSNGTFTDADDVVVVLMPQGVSGSTGTAGTDGIAVIQANMTPTSSTTGGVQSDIINGTTLDFGDVDDFLRMEFTIIGDTASGDSAYYDWKVLYGSDTIFDSSAATLWRLYKDSNKSSNAISVQLDLVVTATDTIVPILRSTLTAGVRSSKVRINTGSINVSSEYIIPAVSISSAISGNNDLKLQLISSDGSSTVDIVDYQLTKYLA